MSYGVPIHAIELINGWSLIITTTGNKFYHNKLTKETTWLLKDEQVQNYVDDLNKDDLILIIAWCRGLKIDKLDDEYILEKYLVTVPAPKDTVQDDDVDDVEERDVLDVGKENSTTDNGKSLLVGYESSDDESVVSVEDVGEQDEDVNEEEEEEEEDVDSSNDEGGVEFDLSDLSSSDEKDDNDDRTEFINLLEESDIDPMGSYELQMKSLINDPRYFSVDNSKKRRELFDEWAKSKLEVVKNDDGDDEDASIYDRYPFLEIVDFLNDKYETLNKKLFLFEFKRKFKDDIQRFDRSEFDKIYKEFVINHFQDGGVERFKDKYEALIVKQGGANLQVQDQKDYYQLIKCLGMDENDVFMNDIKFQSLSNTVKYEYIITILNTHVQQ